MPSERVRSARATLYGAGLLLMCTIVAIVIMVRYEASGVLDWRFHSHLASGEWILRHLALPTTDPFQWTASGAAWHATSWLGDCIVAAAWLLAGETGERLLVSFCAMWSMFTLARVAQYGYESPTGSSLLVTLMVGGVFATTSDVMGTLGCTCLATLIALLHEWKTARRWLTLIAVVPLIVLWANIHSSFVLGVVYLLSACVGVSFENAELNTTWRSKRYAVPMLIACGASILGTIATPLGIAVWPRVTSALTAAAAIEQFAPYLTSPSSLHLLLLGLAVALTCGAIGYSRRRLRTEELLTLALFVCATAFSRSFAPFATLAIVPMLARHFAETRLADGIALAIGDHIPRYRQVAAIACLIPAALVAASVSSFRGNRTLVDTYSVAALSFISKSGLTQRVLHDPRIGGFMSYYAPRIQTFADSRLALHELRWWREYTDVLLGRADPDPFLKRWDPLVVVLPNDLPLRQIVQLKPEYATVFRDDSATVLVKRGSGYDHLIHSAQAPAVRSLARGH